MAGPQVTEYYKGKTVRNILGIGKMTCKTVRVQNSGPTVQNTEVNTKTVLKMAQENLNGQTEALTLAQYQKT
jgi:hypothetical protein